MLEEFRRAKEQRRRLLGVERLAGIEEVYDPRKEGPAFPWANGGVIEDPCLLYYRRLVVVICAEAGLLIFFGYERYYEGHATQFRGHLPAKCYSGTLSHH